MVDIKKIKLAVAFLAKDCDRNLARNLLELQKLNSFFESIDYYAVENDSSDRTKEILRKWEKNCSNVYLNSFNTEDLPLEERISGNRIQRMVGYRNLTLDLIRKRNTKYDYLVLIDIDIYSFSCTELIASINSFPKDATAVFANGRYFYKIFGRVIRTNYYDLFAFDYNSCLTAIDKLNYINSSFAKQRYVECGSAFGGIGIYKVSNLSEFSYNYQEDRNGTPICEHKGFNSKIRKYGKLFIDRELNVLYEKISFVLFLKFLFFPIKLKIFIQKRFFSI